jgi:Ala-tRNA(Pro) deacylase
MSLERLETFLDDHHTKYTTIRHSRAYTAQGVAAVAHIAGRELAKTVMVRLDGTLAMAVLPAPQKVDLDRLRRLAGVDEVILANEESFGDYFPDCELGAMPPFGNLFGMQVFVDRKLTEDAEIAFNAGSHSELIRLSYADFNELVKPCVGDFATGH